VSAALGNLKEAAARPGPASYNVAGPAAPPGGGPFGKAQRTLTVDASAAAVYTNAISKEQAFMYSALPEGDELDQLVAQQKAVAEPAAVGYAAAPFGAPRAVPVPQPAPMAHASYMRSLDTMPRLLHGNIFPFASYVNSNRYSYNKCSFVKEQFGQPWRAQANRAPVERGHFHRHNELNTYMDSAIHLGVRPFGSEKR